MGKQLRNLYGRIQFTEIVTFPHQASKILQNTELKHDQLKMELKKEKNVVQL